jgi:hypothetical protein
MGINPEKYGHDLSARSSQAINLIDRLVSHFSGYTIYELKTEEFNSFMDCFSIDCESPVYDHAYDIFNYFRMYKDGGRFELFKGRQAEWDGPVVVLEKADVPDSNLSSLTNGSEIYRGMSTSEFDTSNFGQSWTTNIAVARKFAFDTYSDKPRGLVAKVKLDNRKLIFYSLEDSEYEVILQSGSIKSAEKIET